MSAYGSALLGSEHQGTRRMRVRIQVLLTALLMVISVVYIRTLMKEEEL